MKTFHFGKFYFTIWQQWSALFKPGSYNWIDFTFIHLEVESSPYKCSKEITFTLLGVGLEITYQGEREDVIKKEE